MAEGVLQDVVVATDATDGAEWDRFVEATEGASFGHLWGWRAILADVLGHDVRYRIARDEQGAIAAVLPLAQVRTPGLGRHSVSLPLLSYGGPIGAAGGISLLVADALAEARREGATLELRARGTVSCDLAPQARKVTVVLPLPKSAEALVAGFRAKLRSQVRRPLKEGMCIRIGPQEVEPFYSVFRRNMRDLGTPVLPLCLFERIAHVFPEQAVFAAVYDGDRPVAGGAGFRFGPEFEITWASSLREYSRSAPNMLLYSGLMEEMIRLGVKAFNFGRCTPGEGTHRFKLQWGGVEEPLPWLSWPQAGEAGPGGAARLASAVWKQLPYPVANALGPVVARRLPWW